MWILQEPRILKTGVSANCLAIETIQIPVSGHIAIRLGLYLNQEACLNGSEPLLYEAIGSLTEDERTAIQEALASVLEKTYEILGQREVYSGKVDPAP